jgi:hypothetical protein
VNRGKRKLSSVVVGDESVTRPLVGSVALGLTRGGPLLVVAPWRHVSLVGTLHLPYEGEPDAPDELATKEEDVRCLLDRINRLSQAGSSG